MEKQISLEEQRQIQLDILKYVDCFCKENNIKYSIAFGTLIGAVRHHGYIPWDDDIDIVMTRENYNIFRKIFQSDDYHLIDLKTDINYPLSMGKICNSHTYYFKSGIRRYFGLFIDIFPIDNVPEDIETREEWIEKVRRYCYLNKVKNTPFKFLTHSKTSFLGKLKIVLIKLFCNSSYIHQRLEKLYVLYNEENTPYVGVPAVMSMKKNFVSKVFPKELFENYTTLEFESYRFSVIGGYDEFLRIFYGDYMQLPPVEQRVGKHEIVAYFK